MRFFIALSAILLATFTALPSKAQMRDSVFANYEAYSKYVDEKIMSRDFKPLVLTLGGRDEYSAEQLDKVNQDLLSVFTQNFPNKSIFRRVTLGNGFSQEARAYWKGENYAYYYAILHDRGDDLVVISFSLNSQISAILGEF